MGSSLFLVAVFLVIVVVGYIPSLGCEPLHVNLILELPKLILI